MDKIVNLFFKFVYLIFIFLIFFLSFKNLYYMLKHYKHDDISKGKIIDLELIYMKGGGNYFSYIIEGEDKKKYHHVNKIVPTLKVGDKVTFRDLHSSNSVWILTSNNIKINYYYYVFDYVLTLIAVLILFIIFYYIKRKINEKRY